MSEHRLHLAPSHALAQQAVHGPAPGASAPACTVVDSKTLLQGRQEVMIAHEGQHYRLRVTALGKLILTK